MIIHLSNIQLTDCMDLRALCVENICFAKSNAAAGLIPYYPHHNLHRLETSPIYSKDKEKDNDNDRDKDKDKDGLKRQGFSSDY